MYQEDNLIGGKNPHAPQARDANDDIVSPRELPPLF